MTDLPSWPHLTNDAERLAKLKYHLALGLGPVPAGWVEWLLQLQIEKPSCLDETAFMLPDTVGRGLRDRDGFIRYFMDGTTGTIQISGHRASELAHALVERLGGEIK